MKNPLLQYRNHTDSTHLRFDLFKTEYFADAFEESMRIARENFTKIIHSNDKPTFANTIAALTDFQEDLDRVSAVFFNLNSAATSDEMQAIAKDISPKLADFSNDIMLNEKLFMRVKAAYTDVDRSKLNREEVQLLEKTYKNFVRNGALLEESQKNKLREIDRKLAETTQKFSENILKSTNEYKLYITDKSRLAGLPNAVIQAAKEAAEEQNKANTWLLTLHAPVYMPIMQFSQDESLREEISLAYASRATRAPFDNRSLTIEIASLRLERAKLLGFSSHADYVLAERMAQNSQTVLKFLNELQAKAKSKALADLEDVKNRKMKEKSNSLNAWDFAFYSEKIKEERYSFDEESLRPYFPLDKVVEGVFLVAEKLYGIRFNRKQDIPVYHPDVQAYEVRESNGDFVGLFYTDFFPRASKNSGAWMTSYREQGTIAGSNVRPHISIVCNFRKPTKDQPSLLSLDEVRTLFHEFGHALHGLLSKCQFSTLSGTNVYWDFVELPSQIMENWVLEGETLALFAHHYKTNEPLPQEFVKKIKEAAKFQAGYQTFRQLSFGLLDMAWHSFENIPSKSADDIEWDAISSTQFFPKRPGTNISCGFSHIFSGGYSAGYYSYKWAEVLDADAFSLFQEKGIFNKDTALSFKQNILEKGGSDHPSNLFRKFRGRDPEPNALLKRDGLI